MNDHLPADSSIPDYAAAKARTLRFSCGAPRSPRLLGDGSRMLFLRSDGAEDTVTSLWMGEADGTETLLADPRALLADADAEDVPEAERARRERAREGGSGIVSYCVDADGRVVVFTINDQLFVSKLDAEAAVADTYAIDVHASNDVDDDADAEPLRPILNPRVSPDGTRVAYSTGAAVIVVDVATGMAGVAYAVPQDERADVHAGIAEFAAAEEMDRYDGFWWGPDSRTLLVERFDASPEPLWTISDPAHPDRRGFDHRYPRALTHNAIVELYAVHLGDDRLNAERTALVDWDNDAYEYLAVVRWDTGHMPLLRVLDRLQQHERILRVDVPKEQDWKHYAPVEDGVVPLMPVTVLETHTNEQWIDLIGGTPVYTPSGALICSINDMENDTNRLTVDGRPFTPVGWQVRAVLDADDETVMCVVQRSPEQAPDVPKQWVSTAADHDARSFDVVAFDYDGNVYPVTDEPGVWSATRAGEGLVVTGRDMADPRAQMTHYYRGESVAVANNAATPGLEINVRFVRLGERRLHAAIVAPTGAKYADAQSLPVLMHPYGGPGFQEVTMSQTAYWDAQWWAEQGYLVVIADGRGTTGRGPAWDRAVYKAMKEVTLEDQIDAVHALDDAVRRINDASAYGRHASGARAHGLPRPELDRVAMIGWSYGGFLSALAVLDAPDTFAAACAGAPPTDWTLYDTCYTERYLGIDEADYVRNSIVDDAPGLRRPLMLIHGFADDNVTIAHSLRLSHALMAAGRDHTFLPLTGITHMTNDPTVARNLLLLQRDFLSRALAR